jgi:hypothetical protein
MPQTKNTSDGEIHWPRKVKTPAEAVRFINAAGYCLLFPIKNLPLPSLYHAVKGAKPPRNLAWDTEVEKLWGWKDELGRRRRAYYGKYFRGRGTFISLEFLPHFLAMRGSPLAPGECNRFYAAGQISDDGRTIWEALAKHGPRATLELRHACKMDSTRGNLRFKRAMLDLQCLLAIVHFGTEQETAAWASGRFELTCRAFPEAVKKAREIAPETARAAIAAKYLEWHPNAEPARLGRLFGWSKAEAVALCS